MISNVWCAAYKIGHDIYMVALVVRGERKGREIMGLNSLTYKNLTI